MSKTNEMVEALEGYIIQKVRSFNEQTSSAEVLALAELVNVVNNCPRKIFSSVEQTVGNLNERLEQITLP